MATTTTKGVALPCPMCGEPDASIRLHMDDCDTFTCTSCDNEFTTDHVRSIIERWQPVLKWIDQAPTQPE